MTVFADEGDIFIYDHVKKERRQLTSTIDGENSPRFTKDQKYIVFTRQNNLYRMSLDGGQLTQLTDIRAGGSRSAPTWRRRRGVRRATAGRRSVRRSIRPKAAARQ